MKILFIAAGPITWGSSRLRCYCPSRYLEDSSVITFDEMIQRALKGAVPKADAYIWQKTANVELIEQLPGVHWYDTCDPMHWFSPQEARAIDDLVDGVMASNPNLASDYTQWSGKHMAKCIPDRLELEHFPIQREHKDVHPVRFIWFGLAVNRVAVYAAWANLARLKAHGYDVELTIFDNRPDVRANFGPEITVYQSVWDLERENEVIASHDIALLPPYPGPWGKVKSNNKNLMAWASGLPVTDGQDYEYLENLVYAWGLRKDDASIGLKQVQDLWTVDQSAKEWERLLCGS